MVPRFRGGSQSGVRKGLGEARRTPIPLTTRYAKIRARDPKIIAAAFTILALARSRSRSADTDRVRPFGSEFRSISA